LKPLDEFANDIAADIRRSRIEFNLLHPRKIAAWGIQNRVNMVFYQ